MIIHRTTSYFTRPADTTQYAQNDLVANSTTAGSVTPLSFKFPGRGVKIWNADLLKSGTTVTNANFRLHLYKDSPTCANGDNGAWSTTVSGYLGYIQIDASGTSFTDDAAGVGVFVNNSVFAPLFVVADADKKLYGLLQNTTATGYIPASAEVFTVGLTAEVYS